MTVRPPFAAGAARKLSATMLSAALAGGLFGCGTAQDMMGMSMDHVPESPEVENAPWPQLVDAPKPEAPMNQRDPARDIAARRRAAAVGAEMQAEAARLRAEARRLDAETGGGRVVRATTSGSNEERAAEALARDEAAVKAVAADDAARLRAEIEAELNAAFGDDAAKDKAAQ